MPNKKKFSQIQIGNYDNFNNFSLNEHKNINFNRFEF